MIVQTQCLSFKSELYQGIHALLTDTLMMALYSYMADLNANTTIYSPINEITGTGYTAGGQTITGVVVMSDPVTNTAFVNFNNVVWPGATFVARGALIYNSSKANRAIAVLDFGSDQISSGQTFTVTLPANTATTALIRST